MATIEELAARLVRALDLPEHGVRARLTVLADDHVERRQLFVAFEELRAALESRAERHDDDDATCAKCGHGQSTHTGLYGCVAAEALDFVTACGCGAFVHRAPGTGSAV